MTEMDAYSLLELEQVKRERAELEESRERVLKATVETIREIHSRRYSDQDIADVLGVQRKTVNSLRLYGQAEPPKGGGSGTRPGGEGRGAHSPGSAGAAPS